MDIQVSAEILEKIFNLNLREAPLSDKELNLKARRLMESLEISIGDSEYEFDVLRDEEHCFFGYADYYLQHCWDESELKNKPDLTIYKQLLKIDAKLGTTQTEQLLACVFHFPQMNLIKVRIHF